MGIQKEREAFEQFKAKQIGIDYKDLKADLDDCERRFPKNRYAGWNFSNDWEVWQAAKASAVPEGFVLMPIKPSEGMIVAVRKCHEGEAYLPHSLYSEFVNQARIEAQEPSNDS